MNWIDPKTALPEIGEEVAVLILHEKKQWPKSAQVYFGIVCAIGTKRMVSNENYLGVGHLEWHFETEHDIYEAISGWNYSTQFKKPLYMSKKPKRKKR